MTTVTLSVVYEELINQRERLDLVEEKIDKLVNFVDKIETTVEQMEPVMQQVAPMMQMFNGGSITVPSEMKDVNVLGSQ